MKAITHDRYGSPDTLELRQLPIPTIGANLPLINQRCCDGAHPCDTHHLRKRRGGAAEESAILTESEKFATYC